MLDKVTMLSHYYTALRRSQSDKSPIQSAIETFQSAIETFFVTNLNGYYGYRIKEVSDAKNQRVTIGITKQNIGLIGTVTLQFSEDSVSMVSGSNLVVSAIIRYSDSELVSDRIARNDALLSFGCSVEHFNQAWLSLKREPPKSKILLKMSFFGAITTTPSQNDLVDLTYYCVALLLQRPPWREDSTEWKNCSSIINILTNYTSTWKNCSSIINILTNYISTRNISQENINSMRSAARLLKGANANTFRKLSVAAMGISVPVFAVALTFAVLAGGPITLALTGIVMGMALTVFIVGAAFIAIGTKLGLRSRAVLFLADKIEESLFSDDHVPRAEISSDLSIASTVLSSLQPYESPLQTGVKINPDFGQLLEALYEETLKPVLKRLYEDNIDQQVYTNLKTGLTGQYNQGQPIEKLKEGIESAAKIADKNDCLTRLYRVCDVEKPKTLQPF